MKSMASSMFPSVELNPNSVIVNSNSENDAASHSLFGAPISDYVYGIYEIDGNTHALNTRTSTRHLSFNNKWANGLDWKRSYEGVCLVSDVGVTLSSINDPTININNPNAPINMSDVSDPAGLAASSLLMCFTRYLKHGLALLLISGEKDQHKLCQVEMSPYWKYGMYFVYDKLVKLKLIY